MEVESTLLGVLQIEFYCYGFDPDILCTNPPAITLVHFSHPHHHEMKEVQIRNKLYFWETIRNGLGLPFFTHQEMQRQIQCRDDRHEK
jgi:hypothetical protein